MLPISDFNIKKCDKPISDFCNIYNLCGLIKVPTSYKNPCEKHFRIIRLWHLKEAKFQEIPSIKNGKVFKTHWENRKGNVNLVTQVPISDFNIKKCDKPISDFCNIYNLCGLIKVPTSYKNPCEKHFRIIRLWHLKEAKFQEIPSIKNGKVFKTHLENRKGNVNLVTQVHYHYVTSRPLTLAHSEH